MAVSPCFSSTGIIKEGFLFKKGGIMKSWSRRYFVLTAQSLSYFKSELHQVSRQPLGRIFLSDIVRISTESTEKRKAFVFALLTKKRTVLLQAANTEDEDKWVDAVRRSLETDKEAEKRDPFRRSLRRLTPGVKRVTLVKDVNKGIGCTIKNAAGHVFVHRIIENGPIAETGVLRPGDELLEIHGVSISNLSVSEVVEIIQAAPTEFLATVRPVNSVRKALRQDLSKTNYAEVFCPQQSDIGVNEPDYDDLIPSQRLSKPAVPPPPLPERLKELNSSPDDKNNRSILNFHNASQHSFDDVGDYDDEDEDDMPPPLPPWTEDALILVDPPPLGPHNIYKTLGNNVAPFQSPQHYRRKPTLPAPPITRYQPPITKCRSQECGLDVTPSQTYDKLSHSPRPRRPRRAHEYEEVHTQYAHLDWQHRR